MTIRQPSNNKQQNWPLLVLAVGTFTLGMDSFVLSGLLPQIARDLSVSLSAAGQLTTLFAVTYAIGSPVIATLTGRWDRRILLSSGLTVFLIGMLAQAIGPIFAVVAIGRVLAALGAAAFQANAYAMAGALAAPERRGRALATVTAGASIATVFGVPFGVVVGQAIGWRGAMWVIAGLALLSAVLVPFLPNVHMPLTSMRARLKVLAHRKVLAVLASTAIVLIPFYLVISYVPLVVGSSTGLAVVFALVAAGVGQVIGNRLVGRFIDTRGALPTLLIGSLGLTVASAALVAGQFWYPATLVVLLALGAFSGLTITPQQHRLFTLAPDVATIALGLNGSAIYVGSGLGAALGGVVVSVGGGFWLPVTAAILAAAGTIIIRATAPECHHVTANTPPSPES